MIYQQFAEFYDELFDARLYDRWLSYTEKRVAKSGSLLDLACGTGRLAIKLSKAGYLVDGADLSENMLSIAQQNSSKAGVKINFIQTDMRKMAGIPKYSTITCFDDSLCYLIKKRDLFSTFKTVYHHLDQSGIFLFDVITPYQTDIVYPGYMYNFRNEKSAFMWSSYQGNFGRHCIEHDLSFFDYNSKKNAYDVHNELHQERTYKIKKYIKMLKEIGFANIKVTSDFGEKSPKNSDKRWFFECHKG